MLELSAIVPRSSIPTSSPIRARAGAPALENLSKGEARRRHSKGASGGQIEAVALGQSLNVAPVEELDADSRIELSQLAQLAVLARHERLLHDRDLQVEILLGEVEVGCERLADTAFIVPREHERGGLVLPRNSVIVENARAFDFCLVREPRGFRTAICLETGAFEAHL